MRILCTQMDVDALKAFSAIQPPNTPLATVAAAVLQERTAAPMAVDEVNDPNKCRALSVRQGKIGNATRKSEAGLKNKESAVDLARSALVKAESERDIALKKLEEIKTEQVEVAQLLADATRTAQESKDEAATARKSANAAAAQEERQAMSLGGLAGQVEALSKAATKKKRTSGGGDAASKSTNMSVDDSAKQEKEEAEALNEVKLNAELAATEFDKLKKRHAKLAEQRALLERVIADGEELQVL